MSADAPAPELEPVDTLVIGSGMSGLAHAFWQAKAGQTVRVLEAAPRVGGVIETVHVGAYRVERAASSVPSSARNLLALYEALDDRPPMHAALPAAKAQYLLSKTGLRRVPRSAPSLCTTASLTLGQRLRLLAEPVMPRVPTEHRRHAETLANFVTRRFGRAVTENFLRPFTKGVYGASPDRLGAADAFPQLVAMEQRYGSVLRGFIQRARESKAEGRAKGKREIRMFAEGTESFPLAIARSLGDRLQCGARVASLEAGDLKRPAVAVLESGERIAAREVVLAVPAWVQASLLRPIAPDAADALDAVPYVPIAVAAVGFAKDRGPAVPDAFGFLCGRGARARILGATFSSRLSPHVAPKGHELLTVYLGGSEDPAFIEAPDAAIRRQVLDDLQGALGGRIRPAVFDLHRWPRAIPLFAPGHRGRMAAVGARLTDLRIRLAGSQTTGVGLDACCAPLTPLREPLPAHTLRV